MQASETELHPAIQTAGNCREFKDKKENLQKNDSIVLKPTDSDKQ